MKRSLICPVLCMLSACAVGPDYMRPDVETPAAFKEAANWKPAQPKDELLKGKWWEVFKDEPLNALEDQVDISNQNIKVAEAQYREASAMVDAARASFFPTVTANAGEARSGTGGKNNNSQSPASHSNVANNYTATLGASWEPDVWGRIRRTVESNEASAQASAADLAAARLSAQAELATDYFQLRVTDAQKQLLDKTVISYQRALDLTKNQYAVGVAARNDIALAQTQLDTTQAQDTDIGVQRAQLEHAIALLLGKPPASFSIATVNSLLVVPNIPISVPSDILERRPDIAAAERNVAVANAQIGVTEAAFYPDLTLSASGGFDSASFAHWFSVPNRVWSLGPSLAETVFDGGLRSAQTAQAVAAYDASVATYRQTVLGGFQEVEDNLAALRIYGQEMQQEHAAVMASQQSVVLTINQYKAGTVNYLNVVAAQATERSNERTELTLLGEQMTAAVTLIKALGGGWDATNPEKPASAPPVTTPDSPPAGPAPADHSGFDSILSDLDSLHIF